MNNFNLESNEAILFEDIVTSNEIKGTLNLTLTSQKIVLEKEKGILKKTKEIIDIIDLKDIKIYNDNVQIEQKSLEVNIQTIKKNIKLSFDSLIKANKFLTKVINAITGTTTMERNTTKIKKAIDTVDDVLGIDTRDTLKGVIENGITGTILNGIKRNKK